MNILSKFHSKPGLGLAPAKQARRPRTRRPSRLSRFLVAGCALALLSGRLGADSLWHEGNARPMFSDKRACQVGDIVTILVQENTTATKNNETKTSKNSSVNSAINAFLYSPGASSFLTKKGALPAMNFTGASSFDGSGSINNSQTIADNVAVRVVDVLPNGNLVIEGARESSFAGERQTVVLRGTIRQYDIMANNTVYSYNISDATIKIVSKGVISDAQRKGWFHKLWDKVAPF